MAAGNGTVAAPVSVAAPAKVNLALLVGPTRPDGFHEIFSLMLPVTLADLVTVDRDAGGGPDRRLRGLPRRRQPRGADGARARATASRRFEVAVDDRQAHPRGGRPRRRQLGRGRDADRARATVRPRPLPRLRYEIAAAVGSDVPFFLWPGPQLAMGRGTGPARGRAARTAAPRHRLARCRLCPRPPCTAGATTTERSTWAPSSTPRRGSWRRSRPRATARPGRR